MNMVTLHQRIYYVMALLADCALNGFQYINRDVRTLLLHLEIASYVVDLLEAENLLSLKRENRIALPCHVCKVRKADRAGFSNAR